MRLRHLSEKQLFYYSASSSWELAVRTIRNHPFPVPARDCCGYPCDIRAILPWPFSLIRRMVPRGGGRKSPPERRLRGRGASGSWWGSTPCWSPAPTPPKSGGRYGESGESHAAALPSGSDSLLVSLDSPSLRGERDGD